jgi:hypothetical protein
MWHVTAAIWSYIGIRLLLIRRFGVGGRRLHTRQLPRVGPSLDVVGAQSLISSEST